MLLGLSYVAFGATGILFDRRVILVTLFYFICPKDKDRNHIILYSSPCFQKVRFSTFFHPALFAGYRQGYPVPVTSRANFFPDVPVRLRPVFVRNHFALSTGPPRPGGGGHRILVPCARRLWPEACGFVSSAALYSRPTPAA